MSKRKEWLAEIEIVRAWSCSLVVLLHSINYITGPDYHSVVGLDKYLISLSSLMSVGTIAFIFISEVLLSNSYPEKLPKGFYLKRIKFIFIPFVFISLFYAIVSELDNFPGIGIDAISNIGNSFTRIIIMFVLNLFGNTHWFILVIFQFYILHHFFTKYIKKFSEKIVLLTSLLVNVAYLSYFNFTKPPTESIFMQYIWVKGYWVPFLGWVFYFTIAYYCGKHYHLFLNKLIDYRKWLFISLPFSVCLVVFTNEIETIRFGSKRIDMIPFAIIVIFLMFYMANKIKVMPPIINILSKYSLGIYLLHAFYLEVIRNIIMSIGVKQVLGYLNIPIYFVGSILLSILTIYIVNSLPFGKYIVGQVRNKKQYKLKEN